MSLFGWFGKEESMEVIGGIGGWIDKQQLTKEEAIQWNLKKLDHLTPFKIVQRIIVSIVFGHWMLWGLNMMLAIWVYHFTGNEVAAEYLLKYAQLELIWGPTMAAAALYLGGGVNLFGKAKK